MNATKMDRNNVEVEITKQVEEKKTYTLNQLDMEITDLKTRKTSLQNELLAIDEKLSEITELKAVVDVEADKLVAENIVKEK